jgi:putative SOS response-associated peptidase YedK
MPFILTQHGERLWLNREAPAREALSVLRPCPADLMETRPVSTAINRAGTDRPPDDGAGAVY